MRIQSLLQKLNDLAELPEPKSAIDIDLMLDYTRVIYADLLELRAKMRLSQPGRPIMPLAEPTLAEMAAAMGDDEDDDELRPLTIVKTMEYKATIEEPEPEPIPPAKTIFIPPAKDIRGLIGINDKYQIVSELFGNDKNAYEEAMSWINQAKSEGEAMKWLQERLWVTEEHSDAAQSFYDLVKRHFVS